VVLYDPDPAFTRELEVYAASPLCARALTLFTLTYDKSVEKRKFVAAVTRERDAFARLMSEKGAMAPLPPAATEAQERVVGGADASLAGAGGGGGGGGGSGSGSGGGGGGAEDGGRDAWGITMKGDSFAARAGGLARGLATLHGGGGAATAAALAQSRAGRHAIIVDMRDFRSKLPSLLDQAGFAVDPCTLEVGDYILSPSTCVERKSLPDLVGSLASGRLYAQAAAMVRHYARPLLLIEFDAERPFELMAEGGGGGGGGRGGAAGEVDSRDVRSKLVLLLLHFPALRVLWARSAHATVEMFKMLCAGQPPPDRAAAQAARRDAGPEEGAPGVPGFGALHGSGGGGGRGQKCLAAIDLLAKLPGVTPGNAKALMANFRSLAALARAEERQLAILMGPANAARLWGFLHKKVPLAELPA
jgi:DNA excision repair protein ERCC-4